MVKNISGYYQCNAVESRHLKISGSLWGNGNGANNLIATNCRRLKAVMQKGANLCVWAIWGAWNTSNCSEVQWCKANWKWWVACKDGINGWSISKFEQLAGLTGNGVRSLSHALVHASLLLDVWIIAHLDLALANFFQSMISFDNRPFPLESAVWFPLIKIYVFNWVHYH